ncbi:polysaccharide pyruvyl transferase family protein [Candidatus Bathyarchaeota archaeon]|nr:polysaccharide pyruvyl transferase family protein [Candidatus Bathyarchaeota archaeon]
MKILCWGWWKDSGNLGDIAIWHGIQKIFRDHQLYTLPSTQIDRFRLIQKVDMVMVTGGTPLYDYGHLGRTLNFLMPKMMRKPLVLFGVGMKLIKSRKGRMLIRRLIESADFITVRDPITKKMMKNLGVKKDIQVTGDSAMVLKPKKVPFSNSDFVLSVPRYLSLDYKRHYHDQMTIYEIETVKKWFYDRIKEEDDVIWMPFHTNHYDDDLKIIRELNRNSRPVITQKLTPEETLYIIEKAKKVIGLRLHSLIFAYMRGIPFETYPYDMKIIGFQRLIENWSIQEIKNRIWDSAKQILESINRK